MKKLIIIFFLLVGISQAQLLTLLNTTESSVVNIVTNGTFDTASDWSLGTGVTISGGVCNYNVAASYHAAIQNVGLTAGKTYGYSIDVVYTSNDGLRFAYHNGSYQNIHDGTITESGTYTGTVEIIGTPTGSIYIRAYDGFVGTIDNVIMWEIP